MSRFYLTWLGSNRQICNKIDTKKICHLYLLGTQIWNNCSFWVWWEHIKSDLKKLRKQYAIQFCPYSMYGDWQLLETSAPHRLSFDSDHQPQNKNGWICWTAHMTLTMDVSWFHVWTGPGLSTAIKILFRQCLFLRGDVVHARGRPMVDNLICTFIFQLNCRWHNLIRFFW